MAVRTIGIHSPGDMGHVVGQVLKANGLQVIACLKDRSQRTRSLATQGGIEPVADYVELVTEADMLLSILVPAQALSAAELLASALKEADTDLIYVDCNAIAPATMRDVDRVMCAAGARVVDASIIGPPPREPGRTRFYASGKHVALFTALNDYGLDIRAIGDDIGQASALKMCFAASTKGRTALYATLMMAAYSLGVLDALMAEFGISQPDLAKQLDWIRGVPRKSRRFVGEMEEMDKTFSAIGLTPNMLEGAAQLYRVMGETHLADVAPEDPAPSPELIEVLKILVEQAKHLLE